MFLACPEYPGILEFLVCPEHLEFLVYLVYLAIHQYPEYLEHLLRPVFLAYLEHLLRPVYLVRQYILEFLGYPGPLGFLHRFPEYQLNDYRRRNMTVHTHLQ